MTDRTFDPNAWLDAYRDTFAPMYKAQQEGLKTLERLARFNYAVAGDYLDSGLAQAQAAVAAKTPAELMSRQAEIGTRFGEKLYGRVQELVNMTHEVQGTLAQVANETLGRAVSQAHSQARKPASAA